ncbi:hypothetical protein OQJ02_05175 [Legionella sp. PATHC032]|nr:hypothetical protein [Legionella sp. PATHC032]MCW8421022.1 hypothetical protein [Legionella sp. PATHC032]
MKRLLALLLMIQFSNYVWLAIIPDSLNKTDLSCWKSTEEYFDYW